MQVPLLLPVWSCSLRLLRAHMSTRAALASDSMYGPQRLLGSRSSVRVLNVSRCPRLSMKALSFMVRTSCPLHKPRVSLVNLAV